MPLYISISVTFFFPFLDVFLIYCVSERLSFCAGFCLKVTESSSVSDWSFPVSCCSADKSLNLPAFGRSSGTRRVHINPAVTFEASGLSRDIEGLHRLTLPAV